jgi:hypothetical protein
MKQILFLATAILFFAACQPSDHPAPDLTLTGQPVILDPADSSIFRPYAQAQQDINNYDTICKKSFDTIPIQYYTVRAADLFAALGVDSLVLLSQKKLYRYPYIRVSLAFEKSASRFKLYIQPVIGADLSSPDSTQWKAGRALYFRRNGSVDSTWDPRVNPAGSAGMYVADLNAPCPNTCGPAN